MRASIGKLNRMCLAVEKCIDFLDVLTSNGYLVAFMTKDLKKVSTFKPVV